MFDEIRARCPFYLDSEARSITCEGITDECKMKIEFKNRNARNQHRSIFCDAKFENCEVFRAIKEKYEDE